MAKEKKKPIPKQEESSSRKGENFNVWVEPEVWRGIQQYHKMQDVEPSKTGLIRAAMIEFLAKRGCWPPKEEDAES